MCAWLGHSHKERQTVQPLSHKAVRSYSVNIHPHTPKYWHQTFFEHIESNWKWTPRTTFICGSTNTYMGNSRSNLVSGGRQSSSDRADWEGPCTLTLSNVCEREKGQSAMRQPGSWKECIATACEWPPCFLALSGHTASSCHSMTQVTAAWSVPHKPWELEPPAIILLNSFGWTFENSSLKRTIFFRKKNDLFSPNNTRYSISESCHCHVGITKDSKALFLSKRSSEVWISGLMLH